MTEHPRPEFEITPRRALIAGGFFLTLVACSTVLKPQHWDESFGPVIPHDTFPADCSLCHESGDWHRLKADLSFDHETETGVALEGAHAEASCILCHNDSGPVGAFAARGCAGCHEDIHRGTLGQNCVDCHNQVTWLPRDQILEHDKTRFPLVGAHAAAECFTCHEGAQVGNFEGLDIQCVTCHSDDLARTRSPNHIAIGWTQDCQECHTPTSWDAANFAHPASFPLDGGHSGLDCSFCHENGNLGLIDPDCVACHREDYESTVDPNHVVVGFSLNCLDCHQAAAWDVARFAHPSTFPLSGAHGGIDCADCHGAGAPADLSTDCVTCHLEEYQNSSDPDHTAAGFPTDCMQCHTATSWDNAMFAHPRTFPLTAGHSGLDCTACHQGGEPGALPTDCVACHEDDYQEATNPNHAATGFPTDCTQCHNTVTWDQAMFAHPRSFPLTAGHAGLDCTACHEGSLDPIPTECVTCHEDDYQRAVEPNHVQAGFPTDCAQCHNTRTWDQAMFTHPSTFPLSGGHDGLDCAICHEGSIGPLPTDCVACHIEDYESVEVPNHVEAGFSTECTDCHNTTTWEGAMFVHPATFPLTGGHGGLDCAECHSGGIGPLSTECVDCHLEDYQQTDDPNHAALGFSTDCTDCHNTTRWEGAMFVHPATFPLTGGHGELDCAECHSGGIGPLSTECVDCHLEDYQQTDDPNHAALGFSTDCTDCHNTTRWEGAMFVHPATFPLTGGHGGLDCAECHSGSIGPLSTDCVDCHLEDYQQTDDPNHSALGFPTDCTNCHNTVTWEGAVFTHPSTFPLSGGHGGLDCAECHVGGVGPLSTDCVDCHLEDYQSADDPNHAASGFSTDCTDCHNTTSWEGATFLHPLTFPLTNAHSGLDCQVCHTGGIGPLSTDCADCHLAEYQSASEPNHVAAGFPMDCAQCHGTRMWEGAVVSHPPSFPLTGGHGGIECAECHVGGIGPLPRHCVDCHLTDFQGADDPNHAVSGFPTDCMECHTATTWAESTFIHPPSFPLKAGHAGLDCASCHQGSLAPVSTDCFDCHMTDYQDADEPNHAAAGFPTNCTECHDTTAWDKTTFRHPASFPLTGGHGALDCAECHQGILGPLSTDCYECHMTDYQGVDEPNHVSAGFPTDCLQCHTTSSWEGAVFNHSAAFPLTSGHAGLECMDCHRGVIGPLPTDCVSCHLTEYQGADDPNHVAAGLPTDCTECHSTTAWDGATFAHPASFPLTAGHGGLDCAQCHQGVLGPLSIECYDCHMTDYQGVDDPNHVSSGFPTDCLQCHTTSSWEGAVFNHPAAFPLTNGHAGLECMACHQGLIGPLPTDCLSCHLSDYQGAGDPNHVAAGFPTDCMECHSTRAWDNATFAHPASFPLTAGHGGLDCAQCHQGVLGPLSTECYDCHMSDYQGVDDPNHAAAGFPTDCAQCHNTGAWEGAQFTHPASFPLTAGHGGLDCAQCHQGNIGPLPSDCVSCHLTDYQQTADPNHAAAGFPTDCTQCHTTTMWEGAVFAHPQSFPLTGGHGGLDCAECHQGTIGPLPTDCVTCHLNDYQSTTDPQHASAGFSTDCSACHTPTVWENADFDHDFPIDSGPHGPLNCVDCHTTPGNQSVFSCTHCHEHRQSEADNEHDEVDGYVWSSPACYECHPQGRH